MNISHKMLLLSCILIAGTGKAEETKKSVFSAEQREEICALAKQTIECKIGKVDPMYVLENLDETKDKMQGIEGEIKARQQQLEKLRTTIIKKETELKNMGKAPNSDALEEKQAEIMNLSSKGQVKAKSLEEYVNRVQQEVQMYLFKKIQEAADEIGKEGEYCIIHAGGILYGAEGTDLSDKIIAKLNKKYAEEKKEDGKTFRKTYG